MAYSSRLRTRNTNMAKNRPMVREKSETNASSRIAVLCALLAAASAIIAAVSAARIPVSYDEAKEADKYSHQVIEALIDLESCSSRYVRTPNRWSMKRDYPLTEKNSGPVELQEPCDTAPLRKSLASKVVELPPEIRETASRLCSGLKQEIADLATAHLKTIRPTESVLLNDKKMSEAFRSAEFVMANVNLSYQAFLRAMQVAGLSCQNVPSLITVEEFEEIEDAYSTIQLAEPPATTKDDTFGFVSKGSNFGYRVDPITGDKAMHSGTDFIAPEGTPVYAVVGGRASVYWHHELGRTVLIERNRRETVIYAHLSATSVADGMVIKVGDRVGAVGMTGRVTGPQLHLERRINDIPVDPSSFTVRQIFRGRK